MIYKFFVLFGLFFFQHLYAEYIGHGIESVSPEQIKKFAPPQLSPEFSNKIRKMFEISSPGMGMLSPDNRNLYFSWRVTGQSQIWRANGPNSFPTQLTSGSDAVSLMAIAPSGEFLIVSKDVNGQENPGLFLLNLKSGLIEELFRKPKVQTYFSFITQDSQYIFFSANDKKPESYNIYKMNLNTRVIQEIFSGDGYWYIMDKIQDGKKLILAKQIGSKQNEIYSYDVQSKNLEPILGQNEKEEYDVKFSANANKFLVLTNRGSDLKKLYEMTWPQKEMKVIFSDEKYEVSDFSIDENRFRILANLNREGYSELKAFNGKSLKPISLPVFAGAEHVFAGTTSKDGQTTMLGLVTAKAPRVSYSYNWKSRKLTQWVLPSAPEVDLNQFSTTVLSSYQSRDGIKIPMLVRFPKQCEPSKLSELALQKKRQMVVDIDLSNIVFNCPVVVHFHGGPEGQSQPGFSVVAQSFVNEGFIFLEPNVRGSDGYGKKWLDADNGPKRENVITDIEDIALWVKKNWKSTNQENVKLGVMGWSYGGYSTLMAMSRFAGQFDAGVALVGMANLVSFLNNTAPYRRALRISEYGDPEKDREALMRLSPVTYVDNIKDPLLIIQGANDPRVPAGEAIQMHELMQKKNLKSQLILFADEGHGSSKRENQILEIGNTIDFFKKHLN